MTALMNWIAAAPQGAIAVLTAIAALFSVIFTQWILGRRSRTEVLTKKLEELYLALNDVAAHNVRRVEAALPLTVATPLTTPQISGSAIDRQGLDLHKRIVMLVRLYFPRLSRTHQEVFCRNNAVNKLIHEAEVGSPLLERDLLLVSGAYRDALVAMEEEIISNRGFLVKDSPLPTRYKQVDPTKTSIPEA